MKIIYIVCLLQGLRLGFSNFQILRRSILGLNVGYGDNPELLNSAALSGSTVRVSMNFQPLLAVAQHNVTIALDCGPLIVRNQPRSRVIIWERQLRSPCGEEHSFSRVTGSTDSRLSLGGLYQSQLTISTTNVFCGAQTADGGRYRCTIEHQGRRQTREMFLLLIGSAPRVTRSTECRLRSNLLYECHIGGGPITLPNKINFTTGERRVTISKFTLGCELSTPVLPAPHVTWRKNGITVGSRALSDETTVTDLSEEFYNLPNNMLLRGFFPRRPIYINENFELVADFGENVWNFAATVDSFVSETTLDNLKSVVLGGITGNWTCSVQNEIGRDEKSSVVFRCLTPCDGENEECVPGGRSYLCVCKQGWKRIPTNISCPSCDISSPYAATKCAALTTGVTCTFDCILPAVFLGAAFLVTLVVTLPTIVCWRYRLLFWS